MRATLPFILSLTLMAGCASASEPPAPASPQAVSPTQPASPRPPSGTPASGTPLSATPTAGGTVTGRNTGTPAAGTTVISGPLAPNNLQAAWTARGLTVGSGERPIAAGFSVQPTSVRLTRGSDATELIVFIYPHQAALEQDWVVGAAVPAPKEGKSAGSFTSAWWNQNVVVVVRTRSPATADARDAFLALGNVAAIVPTGSPSPAASGTAPSGSASAGTPTTGTPTATAAARTPTATAARPTAIPTTSTPRY